MAKFIILCLGALTVCEAGLIPYELDEQPHFPNLKTVHHGHGATSYQNVNVQSFGSVPIPKELQVDDGNEHRYHSQYLEHHDVVSDHVETPLLGLQHYADTHASMDHVIISTEAPYELAKHVEHSYLESDHHYAPLSHYDHEAGYEYH